MENTNTQTFNLDSFIGKQFYALAKRFCTSLVLNTPCSAVIDTEKFIFIVTENTITITR